MLFINYNWKYILHNLLNVLDGMNGHLIHDLCIKLFNLLITLFLLWFDVFCHGADFWEEMTVILPP